MAHWLRLLSALAQDPGLGLLTHVAAYKPSALQYPLLISVGITHTECNTHTHTHMQGNIHTDKVNFK